MGKFRRLCLLIVFIFFMNVNSIPANAMPQGDIAEAVDKLMEKKLLKQTYQMRQSVSFVMVK